MDERLNALIIRDAPSRLEALHHLVELLDVPLSQVAIEARIVTASDSLNQQLGRRRSALKQLRMVPLMLAAIR